MNDFDIDDLAMDDPRFVRNMHMKQCVLWRLMIVFCGYYAVLLIVPTYYYSVLMEVFMDSLNFGTIFALSQYVFAGGIALVYAHYMRKIDAVTRDELESSSDGIS